MLSLRPKITELVFQLYGRSLHPELFQIFKTRTIERGGYRVRVDLTSDGHVVTWNYQGLTLTEVAAASHQPLPNRRRLLSYRLKGERSDRVECRGGVKYQTSFQLEPVSQELFWNWQQELTQLNQREGLLHEFDSTGRFRLGALSYVNLETRNRSILVQAFHTFPDDLAVVKSQTLIELP